MSDEPIDYPNAPPWIDVVLEDHPLIKADRKARFDEMVDRAKKQTLEDRVVEAAIRYRQTVLKDVDPDHEPKTMAEMITTPHATFDARVNQFCRDVDALIAEREK